MESSLIEEIQLVEKAMASVEVNKETRDRKTLTMDQSRLEVLKKEAMAIVVTLKPTTIVAQATQITVVVSTGHKAIETQTLVNVVTETIKMVVGIITTTEISLTGDQITKIKCPTSSTRQHFAVTSRKLAHAVWAMLAPSLTVV